MIVDYVVSLPSAGDSKFMWYSTATGQSPIPLFSDVLKDAAHFATKLGAFRFAATLGATAAVWTYNYDTDTVRRCSLRKR